MRVRRKHDTEYARKGRQGADRQNRDDGNKLGEELHSKLQRWESARLKRKHLRFRERLRFVEARGRGRGLRCEVAR